MATERATTEDARALQEQLQSLPLAEWVRKMLEHYQKTGTYRAEDLRRLLGDPTQGVEVGPDISLVAFLAERVRSAT